MSNEDLTSAWLEDMRDLKLSYRNTHRMLRRYLQQCEQVTKDEHGNNTEHPDTKIVKGAISDINFAIEWLHTGKRPGNKRGIERRAAYQREKLMDPIRMQAFVQGNTAGSPANLSEWQRFQIEAALSVLSDRERECYELHYGMCFSYQQIANMLCLQKGTVQSYVENAQKKINHEKLTSLFLME